MTKLIDELQKSITLNPHSLHTTKEAIQPLLPKVEKEHKIPYLENLGWYQSWEANKPIDKDGNPEFWFNYPFISFLEKRLTANMEIFEYGSGHSTLKFAKNCKNIISIDNDPNWHNYLKNIQLKNATLILQENLDLYPTEITKFNKKYDIIIIDGKRRNACSKLVLDYLKENGMIIFDNLEKGYQKSINFFLENDLKLLEFTGIAPLKNEATVSGVFYYTSSHIYICDKSQYK